MDQPAQTESGWNAEGGIEAAAASKRRIRAAAALVVAALLFGGGMALGTTQSGSEFTANLASAVRLAFDDGLRTEISLRGDTATSILQSTNEPTPPPIVCERDDEEPTGESAVMISEVSWMGSAAGANHEWVELTNVSKVAADISGWQVYDRGRKISITIPSGTEISPQGFFMLVREGAATDVHGAPSVLYRGSLNNTNEEVVLFAADCSIVDLVSADPAWPAGDNATKQTMERDTTTRVWHTSEAPGGTPGQPNSAGVAKVAISFVEPALPIKPQSILGTSTASASTSETSKPITENSELKTEVPLCSQENLMAPTFSLLLNEVAWAGAGPGRPAEEWIELHNPAGAPVPLDGWQLVNRSRTIWLIFSSSSIVAPRGYLLMERDDRAVPWLAADAIFSGAIRNNDEALRLFDRDCRLVDEVVVAASWPAGTVAPNYRSAERSDDRTWHTYNWSPINGIFGTPRMMNSEPAPDPLPPSEQPSLGAGGSGAGGEGPTSTTASASRMLISEVMAGSELASADEFIELYNAGEDAADLTGWCLKKRSSSGSETTLVAASRLEGKTVSPGRYLLLANDGGYRGSVAPDVRWPSSYTLAYTSNAILLYAGCADRTDEAAWAEMPVGQSAARDGWSTGTFSVQVLPTPRNAAWTPAL